jgi:hypothetical protein
MKFKNFDIKIEHHFLRDIRAGLLFVLSFSNFFTYFSKKTKLPSKEINLIKFTLKFWLVAFLVSLLFWILNFPIAAVMLLVCFVALFTLLSLAAVAIYFGELIYLFLKTLFTNIKFFRSGQVDDLL